MYIYRYTYIQYLHFKWRNLDHARSHTSTAARQRYHVTVGLDLHGTSGILLGVAVYVYIIYIISI